MRRFNSPERRTNRVTAFDLSIDRVRAFELCGTVEHEGQFWEDRLVRPTDIYESYRQGGPRMLPAAGEGRYRVESVFLEIEADGIVGRAGPIGRSVAVIILQQFRSLLLGEDPFATERLWDVMHRSSVHGRKGATMMAISAVDCALWDLKGRALGQPVFRLLGGPTRDVIPAYASTLGFSVEPEVASLRARDFAAAGYQAQKWFFKRGPADGPRGMEENELLVRSVREGAGDKVMLMFDAWMSWNPDYTIAMSRRIEKYDVRWIEEPLMPDSLVALARIRQLSPIPIASGEHEYTRWGIDSMIRAGAVDVIQADTYWGGGISEMLKICALASASDIPVIPHGHSVSANAHLISSQSPSVCPMAEDLIKWNQLNEFFLSDPIVRHHGNLQVPSAPGIGMDLAEQKIEDRQEVTV